MQDVGMVRRALWRAGVVVACVGAFTLVASATAFADGPDGRQGTTNDTATLSGGRRPTGRIVFGVYADAGCAWLVDREPVWVQTSCGDAGEVSAVASPSAAAAIPPPAPGIRVVKLQREGSAGAFTTSPIYALVGKAIEYEIQVTNTGNTPLTLTLSDPLCAPATLLGPVQLVPALSGDTLLPGGEVQYTCSHLLTGADASPFINTATVSGQPPAGAPVVGTAAVRANKQAVGSLTISRCARGKVKRTERRHGRRVTLCVANKRLRARHRMRIRRKVRARRRTRRAAFTG